MENDNKRKRPSQGLIDMMNGGYEKLEEERMKSFSYEPKYNSDDGKLNISVVMRSAFFREEMKKAFIHGINFEQLETDSDMDVANVDDKHLPFYEWFAKHYA